MPASETLATGAAAGFFLTALLMGVVKYVQMARSADVAEVGGFLILVAGWLA